MFVRDYRINSRKSLVYAETRWNRQPFQISEPKWVTASVMLAATGSDI